jgi:uncharacterized protein YdeI (YjbR/CyaY-like superfamily)
VLRLDPFASVSDFRAWLESNHATRKELLVRCYKNDAREKGMTYREALDEALCFGWIDGVRRSIDEETFSVRFTPRKSKSYWSAVNNRRANELLQEGRMQPAGRAAFDSRESRKPGRYSFENPPKRLEQRLERKFKTNRLAYKFFRIQAPWYRRTCIFWVMEAKREDTRQRRLDELVASCARGKPIKLLSQAKMRPLP